MKEKRSATWLDLQIAAVRWLAYLVAAAGYLVIWLVEPARLAVSIQPGLALGLIGFALIYNLIATVIAYAGWFKAFLPVATLALDVLLVAAAYYSLGLVPDSIGLTVDPLIVLALVPVVTVSIRFHWAWGLLMGLLVGAIRSALLLMGLPAPATALDALIVLFGALLLLGVAFLSGFLGESALGEGAKQEVTSAQRTVHELRSALKQAEALRQMSNELSASLNFERVIDLALDLAERAMGEWGARGQLVGMVFLFDDGKRMRLAACRNLPRYEWQQKIPGEAGIVARCLEEADLVTSQHPSQDPELSAFTGVSNCKIAAVFPLRAGFENYGAIVFSTAAFSSFNEEQLELFASIASQATIALHNALLYQNLRAERDRMVAVEEEARRKLSRDLHDGPTQSISAIAMRLNFVRKTLDEKPEQMKIELGNIEELARQTVTEIRSMLFTLRPLVLETQGLVPALQALADKVKETDNLNIQVREVGEATSQLDMNQSGVTFYVIEEAVGNARKHSRATLVEVRLWVENELFVAQVADNGVGFSTQDVMGGYETRGSLGMINMRERAELIDGSVDVRSVPGRGTTVTLVVPLRAND